MNRTDFSGVSFKGGRIPFTCTKWDGKNGLTRWYFKLQSKVKERCYDIGYLDSKTGQFHLDQWQERQGVTMEQTDHTATLHFPQYERGGHVFPECAMIIWKKMVEVTDDQTKDSQPASAEPSKNVDEDMESLMASLPY